MGGEERVRKLRWLCRRGMKELDILLERFIDAQAAVLADGGWPQFEALLGIEDDLLWDYVQDPAQSENPQFRELLTAVRERHA